MNDPAILHLARRDDWAAAEDTGWYRMSTRGASLDEVGFVHCSTAEQLPDVLGTSFADLDPASFAVLVLDPGALAAAGSDVRWDRVPGRDDPFPHVYGPVPTTAVIAALDLGPDGELPDLSGLAVATAPPAWGRLP